MVKNSAQRNHRHQKTTSEGSIDSGEAPNIHEIAAAKRRHMAEGQGTKQGQTHIKPKSAEFPGFNRSHKPSPDLIDLGFNLDPNPKNFTLFKRKKSADDQVH